MLPPNLLLIILNKQLNRFNQTQLNLWVHTVLGYRYEFTNTPWFIYFTRLTYARA